jgi:hypothetical protein
MTNALFIGAANGSANYSTKECAFASIGDGLTDTQAAALYTNVQTFNQTLNRQVGAQIVSDADAQAYINRVYTAGGTLTNTEANAVNQLTIDMKSANVWSAMKAVYPMVGSSAAACAQNLKSSSFTGTFTSGWTFASTGVTPNGTSAYMNTGLNPVAQSLTSANGHLSYYARTAATTTDPAEIANYSDSSNAFVLQSKGDGTQLRFFFSFALRAFQTVATGATGFLLGSSTGGNIRRDIYKNGTSVGNNISTDTASSLGNYSLYLGAGNINNTSVASYSNAQCAFASIGDGLTDTQASNFYTSVQTFQTTLSRNV